MITRINDSSRLNGTSFHGYEIETTLDKLTFLFGKSEGKSGDGKVLNEWWLEYDNIPFAIYDWKEYDGYGEYDMIYFHINTKTKEESTIVYNKLIEMI